MRAVQIWPAPVTLSESWRFIGLMQFYRRFIKRFSETAALLAKLTRKGCSMAQWDDNCYKDLSPLEEKLTISPKKAGIWLDAPIPKPHRRLWFSCRWDPAELFETGENSISFFSKRLSPAEESRLGKDRELLSLIYFLQRFGWYLGETRSKYSRTAEYYNFFSKLTLIRLESRWFDFSEQYGTTELTMVKDEVQML